MKRSVVLAGDGSKIGWASGALQVMMDEAKLTFDHIDATSVSVFNLGMLLQDQEADARGHRGGACPCAELSHR